MRVKLLAGLLLLLGIFLRLKKTINIRPENNPALLLSDYAELTKYIEAMARHESGNYKNRLSQEYNNIFSMTKPTIRPQISLSSTGFTGQIDNQFNRWQIYENYTQAIKDLLLYFNYTSFPKKIDSVEKFAFELKKRGYFTASLQEYINGLKSNL